MLDLEEEVAAMFARLVVPQVMRRPGGSILDPFLVCVSMPGFHTFGVRVRTRRVGRDPETKKKNDKASRVRRYYREIVRRRAYRERGKVPGMTSIEVYDAMVPLVGEPAVFKYKDGLHVVGTWRAVGEVGEHGVLLGKKNAVAALGQGASWDEAFENAKRRLFPVVSTVAELVVGSSPATNGTIKPIAP